MKSYITQKKINVEYINNPKTCLSCHGGGANAKPIWDAYDFWPGVYGSAERRFYKQAEKDHYLKFQKESLGKEGIYQYIHAPKFNTGETFSLVDRRVFF